MIYTITCLETLEERNSWPYYGASAFMGYYFDKETALHAARENWCDIAEHCYHYAVVEEIPEGLYAYPRPRWFFKYDIENDNFNPIDEPKVMEHIANVL